ncbi:hypothetical protein N0A02_22845 [Paraburkholderia acidicola]|uniref:Uncharacterized protein n=1 Tax=Paraburkholderia acidicola TaxID=1912599 RepID=A0ABV1LSI0_9BURK
MPLASHVVIVSSWIADIRRRSMPFDLRLLSNAVIALVRLGIRVRGSRIAV